MPRTVTDVDQTIAAINNPPLPSLPQDLASTSKEKPAGLFLKMSTLIMSLQDNVLILWEEVPTILVDNSNRWLHFCQL